MYWFHDLDMTLGEKINIAKYDRHVLHACMLSHIKLCDPMDYSPPGFSVQGFSRQEYWSGLPFSLSGTLSDPMIKLPSLASPVSTGGFFTTSTTWKVDNKHGISLFSP